MLSRRSWCICLFADALLLRGTVVPAHAQGANRTAAVRDEADKTITTASELNRLMLNHRFTDKVQRDGDPLRSDLNGMAETHNLSPLEGEGQSR
jgi:hypothetical protein